MAVEEPDIEGTDFGRIVAFTDGVFAIAITLLVLGFDDPPTDRGFTHAVLHQWPQFLAFLLSFAVIGRMWLVHHRFFSTLHRFDRALLRLNLAYLCAVVLVAYTTGLLGDHRRQSLAAALYAAVLAIATTIHWLMVRHTLRRQHVRAEHRPRAAPFAGRAALFTPAVFLASIPVAFASASVAEVMWVLLAFQSQARLRSAT